MGPVEHLGAGLQAAWFATPIGFPMENRRPSPHSLLPLDFLLSKSEGESTELLPTVFSVLVASCSQTHHETSGT